MGRCPRPRIPLPRRPGRGGCDDDGVDPPSPGPHYLKGQLVGRKNPVSVTCLARDTAILRAEGVE
jgi:hypothetical protein